MSAGMTCWWKWRRSQRSELKRRPASRPRRMPRPGATFLAALGGEAVHEDGFRPRAGKQFVVHLVLVKRPLALHDFLLLAHAGPNVGVDGVRAVEGLRGIVRDGQRSSGN